VLGKTSIEVSMLGFGAHLKKELIKKPTLRDRMIKIGYRGGITIFDVYNRAEYKQYIPMSKSIREFRQDIVLSLYAVHGTGKLQEDIDYALKVFQTDYIDLYRFRPEKDEGVNIMEKNKKEGKIRAIGIASHDSGELLEKINLYGNSIDFVLIVYNFHYNKREPKEDAKPNDNSQLIPLCKKLNIGIIGIKPMGSDSMIDIAYKKGFFRDKNSNIAKSMLRYVYQNTEIDTTLTAMNSMEEVITNLESAYNPAISHNEMDKLKELSELALSVERA
jgi:predicted aldo/keto reductase-like oxidoreductase